MLINLDSWNDGMFSHVMPSGISFPCLSTDCEFDVSLNTEQEMPITHIAQEEENIISESAMEEQFPLDSILATFKEFENFPLLNNSDEINEVINEIKLEPRSPYAQFSESPNSLNDSESIGSDQQLEFTLKTPPFSPLSLSQSPQPFLDFSNVIQKFKLIPVNKQNIKNTECTLQKTDSAQHVYIKPVNTTHCTKADKSQNTIILPTQDNVVLTNNINSQHQELYTSKMQSSPINNHINTQNMNITVTRTETSFHLPQNGNVINTIPNIFAESSAESLVNTSVVLNNEPLPCNDIVIKSEPMNCTPFIMKKSKTGCTRLIIKNETDLVSLPESRQECELRAFKRRQRMIKNRESACLSRKKKKEYMSSLEKQVSELKEENQQLKLENANLKQRLTEMEDSIIGHNKYGNLNLNINKKNVAVFLAVVCMVSINVNGFWGIFLQNTNIKTISNKASISMPNIDQIKHSRTLLWSIDENNNNIDDQFEENFNKNIHQPICPNINQSESIRLDSELRRWIDGESDRDNRNTSLRIDSLNEILPTGLPLEEKPKKKLYLLRNKKIRTMYKTIDIPATSSNNAIEVFSPILSKHASLFEALGRKDDTFYVVWFSGEHLLLPASRTNDTVRPKMSLILPAVSINGTFSTPPDHITMMQIDCEVTNTQLLHLQQSVIPVHLRNSKSTTQSNRSQSINDIVNSPMTNIKNIRNYKPYFMKDENRKSLYIKNFKDVYEHKSSKGISNKNTTYVYKENYT